MARLDDQFDVMGKYLGMIREIAKSHPEVLEDQKLKDMAEKSQAAGEVYIPSRLEIADVLKGFESQGLIDQKSIEEILSGIINKQ